MRTDKSFLLGESWPSRCAGVVKEIYRPARAQRERSGSPLEGDEGYRTDLTAQQKAKQHFYVSALDFCSLYDFAAPFISLSCTGVFRNRILRTSSDSFLPGGSFSLCISLNDIRKCMMQCERTMGRCVFCLVFFGRKEEF